MKRLFCILLLAVFLTLEVSAAQELPREAQNILEKPGITAQQFQSMNLSDLVEPLLNQAKEWLTSPVKLGVGLLSGCFLGAAVLSLVPGSQWAAPLETVCILSIFGVGLLPMLELMNDIVTSVQEWQIYLVGFIPVFSGTMISCGQITQAAVYSGMFLGMAAFSAQLISQAALPLLQVYLALNTAGGIFGIPGLPQACQILHKGVKWALTLLCTAFTGVLGLQTVLAQGADELTLRTGKLLTSGIPVVGTVASQAMGSVLSGLKVLKGSLGFAAIAFLVIQFAPVFVQSLGYYFAYTGGAAVAKAIDLPKASQILDGMSQAVALCLSFLIFFFMLIVLATALMVLMGGGG